MKTDLIIKTLSGNATDEERTQVDTWLEESEQNKIHYEKIALLWNKSGGVYNNSQFNHEAAKDSIRLKIVQRNHKSVNTFIRYTMAVAATILLVIGLGFISNIVQQNQLKSEQVYSAGSAVKEILLADGSHVWLSSNSSIALPNKFSQKHRKVTLKGEAYFEIKHDETNPFKVITGETVTEVLGTSFNIKQDTLSGIVNLIVNSGKVAFYASSDKKNKVILLPGNYASLSSRDGLIRAGTNNDLNFLSWQTRKLKFYNTPIDQVCIELSKHYNKKIFSALSVQDLKLTGTFDDDSLEDILATIELTLDVNIKMIDNEYCIEN